jgi:hypothetical protein
MKADSALRSSQRGACYRAHGWAAQHFCLLGNEIGIPSSLAGQDTRRSTGQGPMKLPAWLA